MMITVHEVRRSREDANSKTAQNVRNRIRTLNDQIARDTEERTVLINLATKKGWMKANTAKARSAPDHAYVGRLDSD